MRSEWHSFHLGDDHVLPVEGGGRRPVEPVAELERSADPAAERVVVGPGEKPVGREPVWRMVGHEPILTISRET